MKAAGRRGRGRKILIPTGSKLAAQIMLGTRAIRKGRVQESQVFKASPAHRQAAWAA
jgi:tRNA U34 5-carboxymethylaminomethyl modifying enzyme MnmG/GidA